MVCLWFRNLFGEWTDPQVRLAIALIYLQYYWLTVCSALSLLNSSFDEVMYLMQIIFEREINIFYPIHKVLYTIMPVRIKLQCYWCKYLLFTSYYCLGPGSS